MEPALILAAPANYSGGYSGAGVADRTQHIFDSIDRLLPGGARGRIPPSDEDGALAGVRVGAVPHPGMLVALAVWHRHPAAP